jgi:tetratricopeptide (TPR) repeat protein
MDEARECFERAVDLDPLSVREHRSLGWMLYITRRFARAEQWLQAALILDREPAETQCMLANLYMSQRRFGAAREQAERCQTDPPDPVGLSVLGACLAHLNRREEALKIVATLSTMAEAGYVQARAIACLHIASGDTERAIESVAKSLETSESRFRRGSNSTRNSIPSVATHGSMSWFRVWGFETLQAHRRRRKAGEAPSAKPMPVCRFYLMVRSE